MLKVPSNSPYIALLSPKQWIPGLEQLIILSKGAMMVRRLMLVKQILPAFDNSFCSNITKVDSLEYLVVSCNFKYILIIRELYDAKNVNPWVKCDPSKHYLWKDFVMIPLHIALEHQGDTNMYCLKHDQQKVQSYLS